MFHNSGAELAAQHRRALLESAERYRQTRLAHRFARPNGSAARQWLTGLWQSGAVHVRPVRADDGGLLKEAFGRLGPESRRRRFLTTKNVLTADEVRYLTDVDHHDHEALLAVSKGDGRGVGIARFIRDAEESDTAELAVTVVDEWQLRGIGSLLVTQLSNRAREEGVTRFSAVTLVDNVGARRLLGHVPGVATVVEQVEDQLSYRIELTGAGR